MGISTAAPAPATSPPRQADPAAPESDADPSPPDVHPTLAQMTAPAVPDPFTTVCMQPAFDADGVECDTAAAEDLDIMKTLLGPWNGRLPTKDDGVHQFGCAYDGALLDAWVKQPSPCCAAAAVAGAINGSSTQRNRLIRPSPSRRAASSRSVCRSPKSGTLAPPPSQPSALRWLGAWFGATGARSSGSRTATPDTRAKMHSPSEYMGAAQNHVSGTSASFNYDELRKDTLRDIPQSAHMNTPQMESAEARSTPVELRATTRESLDQQTAVNAGNRSGGNTPTMDAIGVETAAYYDPSDQQIQQRNSDSPTALHDNPFVPPPLHGAPSRAARRTGGNSPLTLPGFDDTCKD